MSAKSSSQTNEKVHWQFVRLQIFHDIGLHRLGYLHAVDMYNNVTDPHSNRIWYDQVLFFACKNTTHQILRVQSPK